MKTRFTSPRGRQRRRNSLSRDRPRAPEAVVVVVDSDRIYRECTACKSAQGQLQAKVTALQTRQKSLADGLRPEGQSIQAAIGH